MRTILVLFSLMLASCSTLPIPNPLGGGGLAGTSSLRLLCPDGKSGANYSSGMVPQLSPLVATVTCSTGVTMSASMAPGIDVAALAAVVAPLVKGGAVGGPKRT